MHMMNTVYPFNDVYEPSHPSALQWPSGCEDEL